MAVGATLPVYKCIIMLLSSRSTMEEFRNLSFQCHHLGNLEDRHWNRCLMDRSGKTMGEFIGIASGKQESEKVSTKHPDEVPTNHNHNPSFHVFLRVHSLTAQHWHRGPYLPLRFALVSHLISFLLRSAGRTLPTAASPLCETSVNLFRYFYVDSTAEKKLNNMCKRQYINFQKGV